MKQRLGIAHALLGDPSVLILDEPANGLDPAGIRWMRGLLKSYADRGGTVLLSSHLLNEVEQIADEMILIGRGRIVAEGTKDELLAGAEHKTSLVTALDNELLAKALKDKGYEVAPAGTGLRVDAAPVDVGRVVAENAIVLTDLRSADGGLEELFLALTEDTQRDDLTPQTPPPPRRPPPKEPRHERDRRCPPMSLDLAQTPQVPLGRLVKVETRKALDTRAGRWLVIGILGVVVLVEVIVALVAHDEDRKFSLFLSIAGGVLGYFLPIVVIMLVTSEASQRNGLVDLHPRAEAVAGRDGQAPGGRRSRARCDGAGARPRGAGQPAGQRHRRRRVLARRRWAALLRAVPVQHDRHPRRLRAGDVDHEHAGRDRGLLRLHADPAQRGRDPQCDQQRVREGRALDRVQHRAVTAISSPYSPSGEEWAQIAVTGVIWLVIPLVLGIWRLLRIEFK